MKRTIVKFGAAALLMGMFLLMPSCKGEAAEAEETTEAVEEGAATEEAAEADDDDTTGGKDIKTAPDPAKTPPTGG